MTQSVKRAKHLGSFDILVPKRCHFECDVYKPPFNFFVILFRWDQKKKKTILFILSARESLHKWFIHQIFSFFLPFFYFCFIKRIFVGELCNFTNLIWDICTVKDEYIWFDSDQLFNYANYFVMFGCLQTIINRRILKTCIHVFFFLFHIFFFYYYYNSVL
jgi:hypothetical protein